jgi:hypothetical protein
MTNESGLSRFSHGGRQGKAGWRSAREFFIEMGEYRIDDRRGESIMQLTWRVTL